MTSSSPGSDVDESLVGAAQHKPTSALETVDLDAPAVADAGPVVTRRRSPIVLLGGALAVAAAAVVAAVAVTLGGDEAERAPLVDPALMTEPVQVRQLTREIEAVTAVASRPAIEVGVAPDEPTAVVTAAPLAAGDAVGEGMVVVELDGRPVIALEGVVPSHRDLRPGDEGPDVTAAQAALARLGVLDRDPSGVFDTATEAAVVELYDSVGYEAPGPTDDDLLAIADAQAAVDEARRAFNDAEIAVSEAEAAAELPRATILQLDADVAAAQAALAAARADAGAALAAPTAARATAEAAVTELKATIADLEGRVDATETLLADGVDADGDPLDDAGRADLEIELEDLRDDVAEQRPRLDVAEVALVDADAELQAVQRRTDEVVRAAEARLAGAETARSAANVSADTDAQRQAVDDAEDVLDRAEVRLEALESSLGIRWPRRERLVVDGLPRQLIAVTPVGATVETSAAELATGRIDAVISVTEADAAVIEIAQPATISGAGFEAESSVVDIAEAADADGRISVTVRSDEAVAGVGEGATVRVSIPVAQTRSEVPVVPVAALDRGLGTSTQITVIDADGVARVVRVVPGLSHAGFVTVDPVNDELTDTDRVVVGIDRTGTTDQGSP